MVAESSRNTRLLYTVLADLRKVVYAEYARSDSMLLTSLYMVKDNCDNGELVVEVFPRPRSLACTERFEQSLRFAALRAKWHEFMWIEQRVVRDERKLLETRFHLTIKRLSWSKE